jgi:hypothetical protein
MQLLRASRLVRRSRLRLHHEGQQQSVIVSASAIITMPRVHCRSITLAQERQSARASPSSLSHLRCSLRCQADSSQRHSSMADEQRLLRAVHLASCSSFPPADHRSPRADPPMVPLLLRSCCLSTTGMPGYEMQLLQRDHLLSAPLCTPMPVSGRAAAPALRPRHGRQSTETPPPSSCAHVWTCAER